MDELTIEQFAATILWEIQHPHQIPVRWLCASGEHKQERLTRLQKAFENWRNEELQMKQERERQISAICA